MPEERRGYQRYTSGPPGGYEGPMPPAESGGGAWEWVWDKVKGVGDWIKDNSGDILQTGGDIVGGYMDAETQRQALAQQKEQFEKNYALNQNEQAARAQNQLNRAPLWDQATAAAKQFKPPMPFQPRDYTRGGVEAMRGQPTGGVREQMEANRTAAANYKQGDGGIDTSVLKYIVSRLGMPATPGGSQGGVGSTPNAEMDYSQFTLGGAAKPTPDAQHVPVTAPQEAGSIPGLSSKVMATEYPDYFFPRGIPDDASPEVATQEWKRLYGNAPIPQGDTFSAWWNAYRQVFNQAKRGKR